jgi:hypothetical protein
MLRVRPVGAAFKWSVEAAHLHASQQPAFRQLTCAALKETDPPFTALVTSPPLHPLCWQVGPLVLVHNSLPTPALVAVGNSAEFTLEAAIAGDFCGVVAAGGFYPVTNMDPHKPLFVRFALDPLPSALASLGATSVTLRTLPAHENARWSSIVCVYKPPALSSLSREAFVFGDDRLPFLWTDKSRVSSLELKLRFAVFQRVFNRFDAFTLCFLQLPLALWAQRPHGCGHLLFVCCL